MWFFSPIKLRVGVWAKSGDVALFAHKPRDVDTWRDGLVWAKWRVGVGFAHKGGGREVWAKSGDVGLFAHKLDDLDARREF